MPQCKFVALYALPADPSEFLDEYFSTHLPLVAALPGLARTEVSRVSRVVRGEPGFSLMAEMYFDDREALRAALRSPEWAAAGENLALLGGVERSTMFMADLVEAHQSSAESGRV